MKVGRIVVAAAICGVLLAVALYVLAKRDVSGVSTDRKVVALTFDDGPSPVYTPQVLDILAREKVHATFFDVGKLALAHPDIVKREIREGHVVASHTYNHILLLRLNKPQTRAEIEKGAQALCDVIGKKPMLFRPPYGRSNANVLDAARMDGFRIINWGLCLERGSIHTPRGLADRTIGKVKPGIIILTHDGATRPQTDRSMSVKALPILIQGLKKQGYKFVTVPELLAIGGQKVAPYSLPAIVPQRTHGTMNPTPVTQ